MTDNKNTNDVKEVMDDIDVNRNDTKKTNDIESYDDDYDQS
jgi:hypothetical protein